MAVGSMGSGSGLIVMTPVLMHGLITCAQIYQEGLSSPYDKILISPLKNLLTKVNAEKHEYLKSKADVELYTALYLLVGVFFGISSLISVLLYMQVLRVRTMINSHSRQAFTRFDQMIRTNVLSRLPSVCAKPYDFVCNFLVSMGSLPDRPGEINPES